MDTSEEPNPEAEQEHDRLARLAAALRQEIALEPVPERLRELAGRLEQALKARLAEAPPDGEK